jgi:hypothetical protein
LQVLEIAGQLGNKQGFAIAEAGQLGVIPEE